MCGLVRNDCNCKRIPVLIEAVSWCPGVLDITNFLFVKNIQIDDIMMVYNSMVIYSSSLYGIGLK